MNYQWYPAKATANVKKHGVEFADAIGVFDDPGAITIEDSDSEGEHGFYPSVWISWGASSWWPTPIEVTIFG